MAASDRFQGRVALVTGAAKGIGEATARLLAEEGARVVLVDLDPRVDDVASEIGDSAAAVRADVGRAAEVQGAVDTAVQRFGGLDILVCAAGIIRDNLAFRMTEDDWDAVMTTHLKGTFLFAQAAQRVMVERRYGKMVFLSSTSALGNRGQANYSTAKAGLQGLARTLALELGPFNINVNAVAPGFVETAMTRATAERMGVDFEQMKQARAEQTPLRRVAQPRDLATCIAFFCSDESSFVTGQTLYARGGP